MDDDQLRATIDKYWVKLLSIDKTFPSPSVTHLLTMLPKMQDMIREGHREKVMRWLGFIQGALWVSGEYTLDELKSHNR